jgi:acetyl-CoA carboxylase biotin carboxyl carrier protein
MNPEEMEQLKSLIEFLKEHNIGEFILERADLKVQLKFASTLPPAAASIDMAQLAQILAAQQAHQGAPIAAPAAIAMAPVTVASAQAPTGNSAEEAGLHTVKSPIVGTFYESSSPGSPAFVKVGDQVESGQVLCIVEAMKLMNEIESDLSGEIVKRLVTNGQPVEYGQPLFTLRPR